MSDPRWTVEDEFLGPQRPMLVFEEPGFGQVIAVCMARRSGRTVIAPTAADALVAAVRDAARLPEVESRLALAEAAERMIQRSGLRVARCMCCGLPCLADKRSFCCGDATTDTDPSPVPGTPTPTGQQT